MTDVLRTTVELQDLQSEKCQVYNHYHGVLDRCTQQICPKFVVYSCLGEALNITDLWIKLSELSGSFVIIPTVRTYSSISHETDQYKILSVPSLYAHYSFHIPELSDNLRHRKIQKHFLSLNNRAQWPRQGLAQFLLQYNLIEKCMFSYHCQDRFNQGQREIFDITNNKIGHTWFNNDIDIETFWNQLPIRLDSTIRSYDKDRSCSDKLFYTKSFASIICETYIDENWDPFFTEKTFKPLAYGHPFMVHSSAGALKLLRQLGFETFPEIFDESYDDIESPQLRFEHILREIQRICDLSLDDLQSLYLSLIPKLLHNQRVFREFLPRKYSEDIQRVKLEIKQVMKEVKNT